MNEYTNGLDIPGTVEASENVIKDMIGYAAMTSYGIAGMVTPNPVGAEINRLLPFNNLRRGIVLHNNGDSVSVELYVVIKYGTNLSVVSENLADTVRYALEEYAQIPVDDISISIQGIR